MECFVFILHSKSADIFYVGATNDINDRLRRHNSGLENYTQKHKPWTLVWFTQKTNKSEAFKLEKKLKNLSKERKFRFLEKYSNTDEA